MKLKTCLTLILGQMFLGQLAIADWVINPDTFRCNEVPAPESPEGYFSVMSKNHKCTVSKGKTVTLVQCQLPSGSLGRIFSKDQMTCIEKAEEMKELKRMESEEK